MTSSIISLLFEDVGVDSPAEVTGEGVSAIGQLAALIAERSAPITQFVFKGSFFIYL